MTFGYNRRIYTESIYNTLDDRDLPVAYTRYMTESLIYRQEHPFDPRDRLRRRAHQLVSPPLPARTCR